VEADAAAAGNQPHSSHNRIVRSPVYEGAQKAPLGSQFFEQAFSFRLVPPSEYDSVAVLEDENDRGRVGAFVDDLTEIDPVVQDQFRAALIDFATRVYSLRYVKEPPAPGCQLLRNVGHGAEYQTAKR